MDSGLIVIVMMTIPSMAFLFLFTVLRTHKVSEEKLRKIFKDDIDKILKAKDDEELKQIIRGLSKKQKKQLKVLLESQDIRDVLKAIKVHITKEIKE